MLAPHGVGGVAQLKQAQLQLLAQYAHEDQGGGGGAGPGGGTNTRVPTHSLSRDDNERADNQLAVRRGPTAQAETPAGSRGALDEHFAPLPVSLMRKYITYARACCFPMLETEALKILHFLTSRFALGAQLARIACR